MNNQIILNKKEKINSSKELAKLIKKNLCVIMKISASWCGPCKNQNFLNNYDKLKNNFVSINGIKFIELDIDLDTDIIEDKNYYDIEINSVPTFIISKDGNFTRKYEGIEYLQQINEYLYNVVNNL